ncbi:cation/H(+) antiporter 15-like [Phalaenopsis equestris]|uniref:cation/H(+) antiporter 15-like n=1 Tax=Phalaenopsis equestris TaxID=78828 RepID=UPI0009E5E25B|nr:cation/H(+) antiporter 15-like [Phalaenopsis equestris]
MFFLVARLSHAVLGPIGLPQPLCHAIAGILLGPSGLSRNRWFQQTIFPKESWVHLDHISLLAFILFIFVIAVKIDLSQVRKSGRKAAAIAQIGTALPFISIFISVLLHPELQANQIVRNYIIHFAGRWALTSNIVITSVLTEFKLLTTKLGRLAITSSLIADFYCVIISAAFLFVATLVYQSVVLGLTFLCSCCGFIAAIWLFARPVAIWIIRRTPEGSPMDEGLFLVILLMAIGSSIAGELIGQSVTFGPLLLGIIIPGGAAGRGTPIPGAPPLGTAVVDRLERLVSTLFLPVFLIIAGLRCNLYDVLGDMLWLPMTCLIFVSVAAKFFGVIVSCLYCKMNLRDACVLALMLNCRGIIEINTFNNLEDFNQLSGELYAVNIIGIILVGGISAMLLKALYHPSNRLAAHRRRTVQDCGGAVELRALTCVHCEDHVPPLLTLALSPTSSSPLCIYLLHLSPLVGRNNTILAPYKKKQRDRGSFRTHFGVSSSLATVASASAAKAATEADRIVNSFVSLEQQYPTGLFTIQPFIGVSPYATMHDDICSLAADKMCNLILLPFHRRIDADVPLESVNPALRSVNTNVLLYAPCSVAILVSCNLSTPPISSLSSPHSHRIAVFFLGGPDDREALAIAARMTENPCIHLHVLRLMLPLENRGNEEEMDKDEDDEAVEEFRLRTEGVETVEYREEEVKEGAETVNLMREMSEKCGLLVVGREEGRVSPFTAGLEMWSEYPELGVIGDILASKDFGGKGSVMVVQQRSKMEGSGARVLRRLGSRQSSKTESVEIGR